MPPGPFQETGGGARGNYLPLIFQWFFIDLYRYGGGIGRKTGQTRIGMTCRKSCSYGSLKPQRDVKKGK